MGQVGSKVGQVGNLPDSAQQPKPSRQVANLPHIQVRLTDFGIGQLLDREALERAGITATGFTETVGSMTDLSSRTGTRLYMAPELLAGRPPSIQSDIYSLGVLLYQMILGDLSQPMTTDWERHVSDPLLRDDLRHCLAGNPSDRFSSADELAERLRNLRRRWVRRRASRVIQIVTSVSLIIAFGTGIFSFLQSHQIHRERALRLKAEQEQYYSNIALAEKCTDEHRYDRALSLLSTCPKQFRDWEWGYLQRRCPTDLVALKGHDADVLLATFTADGEHVVTASADGTVKRWDTTTGRELHTLRVERPPSLLQRLKGFALTERETFTYAISADGRFVLTGGRDAIGRIWDTDTAEVALTLKGHSEPICSSAFSTDDRRVATGSWDNTVKVWVAATGKEISTLTGHTRGVSSVAFSSDGQRLITSSFDHTAKIWDIGTGQALVTLKGHTLPLCCAELSPDGRYAVTGSRDKLAMIWDAQKGEHLHTLKGHTEDISSVAFSPDSRHAVTGGRDGTARVWDVQSGGEVLALKGHNADLASVAFDPNGRRIVTASDDSQAVVWDVDTRDQTVVLDQQAGAVNCAAFTSDLQWIVTGHDDGAAQIWDTKTGRKLHTLSGHKEAVTSVAFSYDDQQVITGGRVNIVKTWNARTGEELLLIGGGGPVNSVAFSPDGGRIVIGRGGGEVVEAKTGTSLGAFTPRLLFFEHGAVLVRSAKFSPDGRRIVGAALGGARIWDTETGDENLRLTVHDKEPDAPRFMRVRCVTFNSDGRYVLTGNIDGTAEVWDAGTGKAKLMLAGHAGEITSLAFSPNGKRLLTGSYDNTAKLWDAESGRELLTLGGHKAPLVAVAFSADGCRTATATSDGTVIIYNALPWRDEDLPGDASMSYDERIQIYKIEQWKKRQQE